MEIEIPVVIVGAGPAGLATSGCLNKLSISNIILERDNCHASLWKKRTYDRLKLHLGKEFCNLPHKPFSSDLPTFVPRIEFLRYLDSYVKEFNICIKYNMNVESACFDGKWRVSVKDTTKNVDEVYVADYLVVATGENAIPFIPVVNGLEKFEGEYMHCSQYLNGRPWYDKNVLVVGCGNSGMEIAYDLSNWGANTSIVVRSTVHFFTKEMVYMGRNMLNYLNTDQVDDIMVLMSKMVYGDMSSYGLTRPKDGPFALKAKTGRTPTIDVGCVKRIKKGKITVFPAVSSIKEDKIIEFEDGRSAQFDVIVFATGYRNNVLNWLQDYQKLFNENGMPKPSFPNHWKGQNGIYCAGFSQKGLEGIAFDAQKIADDIGLTINANYSSFGSNSKMGEPSKNKGKKLIKLLSKGELLLKGVFGSEKKRGGKGE